MPTTRQPTTRTEKKASRRTFKTREALLREIASLKDREVRFYRLDDDYVRLKAACHSLTVRLMTYLARPTPKHLYAIHQILRDVEQLTGDTEVD